MLFKYLTILFLYFNRIFSLICPPKAPFCFNINEVNGLVQFILEGPIHSGTMSIGLGTSMNSCEIFSGYLDNSNQPKILHFKGIGYTSPELIKKEESNLQLINEISGIFSKNLRIGFTKPFNSTLNSIFNINKNGINQILWSYSKKKPKSNGKLIKHQVYGIMEYNFNTKESKVLITGTSYPSNLVLIHGFLMLINWLILPAFSIFIARFLKNSLGALWFHLHYIGFILTGLLSIVSIVLIYLLIGNEFNSIHSIIGLIILILYFIQIGLGILIDKLFKSDRKNVPIIDKIHWWFGRLILLLAISNIIYGIIILDSFFILWIVFSIIIFLIFIAFLYGHIKLGKVNH